MPTSRHGGFHHIDLNVTNLKAARHVYGILLEFLGYQMVKDDDQGCEWDFADIDGRVSVGLRLADPQWVNHLHRRYAPGLHHLAWRAESREHVDAFHQILISSGVPVLDAPAEYPEYSQSYYAIFFEDPDGIKLELLHED
ncbi:MAG: VOC family protein [Sphingomonadaceae bacterium]|jgi:catechol 2,3-dioxygenase-like lactoylglutathione lyase family enzyme